MGRVLHQEPEPVAVLRRVPFVRELHYTSAHDESDLGYDGTTDIHTPEGPFRFAVEVKRSYLTRSAVDQLLALLHYRQKDQPRGVILLARYIPRAVAERLVEANVNFADDAGNVHLALGQAYNWTVIGMPALDAV